MINYSQLKKFIVNSSDTLENVIKIINSNGKGVALVVDSNQILKGLLTDGDIRKLLLKGVKLSDKIKDKFNKNFFFVNNNSLHKVDLQKIKKDFMHVPVLEKRKIVSLLLYDDLLHNKFTSNHLKGSYNNKEIIKIFDSDVFNKNTSFKNGKRFHSIK